MNAGTVIGVSQTAAARNSFASPGTFSVSELTQQQRL